MIIYRIITNFNYYVQEKWFSLLALASIVLLLLVSKSPSVILPLLIGFTGIYTNNRTLAKMIVITVGLFLIISYIFSLFGLNGGDVISKPLFGADNTQYSIATALGLANPNIVMAMFVNIVILTLYLCKRRVTYTLAAALLLLLAVILGIMTGSTTGLVICILAIVLTFSYKYIVGYTGEARHLLRKITPYMFALVTFASLAVAMTYNANNPGIVNDFLTNRPYFWSLRVENGSVLNMYGDNDKYQVNPESHDDNQTNHFPLDNEPLYTLVHYGVIIYLLFLYIFYSGSRKLKDTDLLVYIFVVCVAIFVGKIIFYGFVFIFLVKAIVDYRLLKDYTKSKAIK